MGWLLSYLSCVNVPLAVDALLLTDIDMANCMTVITSTTLLLLRRFLLVKKLFRPQVP